MAKICSSILITGLSLVIMTKELSGCKSSCIIKGTRNKKCVITNLGNDCVVPTEMEDIFLLDERLAPLPSRTQIIPNYKYNDNGEFIITADVIWKLSYTKGKPYVTGFLIERTIYTRIGEEKNYYLVHMEPKFTIINKKSRFMLTCLNLKNAFFVEIKIWSLPNRWNIQNTSLESSHHLRISDRNCFTRVNTRNGQWQQFVLEQPTSTSTKRVIQCRCPSLEYFRIDHYSNNITISLCPVQESVMIQVLRDDVIVEERQVSPMACNITMEKMAPGHNTIIIKRMCENRESNVCQKKYIFIPVSDQSVHSDSSHQYHIVSVIIGTLFGIICVATFLMFSVKKCIFARKLEEKEGPETTKNNYMTPIQKQNVLLISDSNPQHLDSKTELYYFSEILRENSINVLNMWDSNNWRKIMESQFDWLEKCVDYCNHFVFIFSTGLFRGLKTSDGDNDKTDKEIGHCDHITNLLTYLFVLLKQNTAKNKQCYIVSFGYDGEFSENINFDQTHLKSSFIRYSCYDLIEVVRSDGCLKTVSLNQDSWSKLMGNMLSEENYTPNLHTVKCNYFLAVLTGILSEQQNNTVTETQIV